MTSKRLEVSHISKSYKKRTIVEDLSMILESGEIIGLLGPNGAGKTTSFYMVAGLITPDKGQISMDGRDITQSPMHIRARLGLGYLPQESSIFKKLTVYENILAIIETLDTVSIKERHHLTQNILEEFRLEHLKDQKGYSLSGGERRRLEIARVLAINPEFILFDEPFAGVDPISVQELQTILRYVREKGIGILITDHNVRETLGICDRAYIMNQGRLIASGLPDEILQHEEVKQVYLGEQFRY
ncbi:MAG: LPS export ABC transporter ATP-binding protein [Gammaproteobacteria bacterium]|nr:MAG: LPS export ABC transporter ATP-binding protein [Gammaproteobacteria bacterium]